MMIIPRVGYDIRKGRADAPEVEISTNDAAPDVASADGPPEAVSEAADCVPDTTRGGTIRRARAS